ncbi:MAG: hypothetical protein GF401_06230 [Chitinivibrionales bacterium]|nr:hypothetical protein [Chitinivibrionales bacterium]
MQKTIIPDIEKIQASLSHTNIDPEIKTLFDSSKMDEVEDRVMNKIESKPEDLDYILPILRALIRRKGEVRAEMLLQLLVDTIREKEKTELEYELFSSVLTFWPENTLARAGLMEHIQKAYGDSPDYELLVNHCDIENSRDPFQALHLLETWLRFGTGQGVYLPQRGVGRIKEIKPRLNVVRVEFQENKSELLSLRITEAERLLEFLPKGHILLEKLENLPALQTLAKENPDELIKKLFTSVDRPLKVSEIKEHLSQIITPKEWSSWWSKARKNPQLTISSGTKPIVSWSDSAADADKQIGEEFAKASPREKLDLLQKHSDRSEELVSTMLDNLATTAAAIKESKPALAFETILAIDKAAKNRPETESIGEFIARKDAPALITKIKDRTLRKNAVAAVKDIREDCADIFIRLLRTETDNQIVTLLYESLLNTKELETLLSSAVSDPESASGFYLWICRNILTRPELNRRLDYTFAQKLVGVINNPSFKSYHASLRKLFDPGNVVDKAIRNFDKEQAINFLSLIDRSGSLESYRKEDLRSEINRMFPDSEEEKEEYFYTTAEALDRKRKEFEHLTKVEIPENTEQLRKAKELGDLRENFEYKAARMRQEMLSSRAKTLHDQISMSKLIVPESVDTSAVSIGAKVVLKPVENGGEIQTITILGAWESDPSRHIYSHQAPAANALLGKKKSDKVEFNNIQFYIEDIKVWNE